MTRRQVFVGMSGGLVVAAVLPLALRSLTRDFTRHTGLFDPSALQCAFVWFALGPVDEAPVR